MIKYLNIPCFFPGKMLNFIFLDKMLRCQLDLAAELTATSFPDDNQCGCSCKLICAHGANSNEFANFFD